MGNDIKIFLGVIGGTLLLIFGAAFIFGKNSSDTTANDQTKLVRVDSWKIGSESAKVTIVEFSDFQCPSCKVAQPVLEAILAKYPTEVKLVYRHFPLPSHEFGFISAEAAEAAGLQGKFWEMHAKLFEISPDLSRDQLIQAAKDLKLDIAKFTSDIDSDSVRQKVLTDQADGNALSVNATPTFFVNGTRFVGSSDLESEVTKLLK